MEGDEMTSRAINNEISYQVAQILDGKSTVSPIARMSFGGILADPTNTASRMTTQVRVEVDGEIQFYELIVKRTK